MLNRQEKGATMTRGVTPGTQQYKVLRYLDRGPNQTPRIAQGSKMSKLACTQTLKALKRKGLVDYEKSIGWYQTVNGAAEMDRWEEAL